MPGQIEPVKQMTSYMHQDTIQEKSEEDSDSNKSMIAEKDAKKQVDDFIGLDKIETPKPKKESSREGSKDKTVSDASSSVVTSENLSEEIESMASLVASPKESEVSARAEP